MGEYIISEIIPKTTTMSDLHKVMLGCKCHIIDLEVGHRCMIGVSFPRGQYYRISTSAVEGIQTKDSCDVLIITTKNTIYHLTMTDDGEAVQDSQRCSA